jgi:hypothetical protein
MPDAAGPANAHPAPDRYPIDHAITLAATADDMEGLCRELAADNDRLRARSRRMHNRSLWWMYATIGAIAGSINQAGREHGWWGVWTGAALTLTVVATIVVVIGRLGRRGDDHA